MYFDIASLIFVLIFSFLMMKKGGAQAILSLVSFVLSVVVALSVYPYLSDFLYTTPLDENVSEIVKEVLTEKGSENIAEVISAMPDFLANSDLGTISGEAEVVLSGMSDTLTNGIINIITFVLVLVATKIILLLLSGVLDILTKIPLIKQANSAIGFLCGIGVSFVVLSVAVYLLSVFSVGNEAIYKFMEGSYVVSVISSISPF